MKKINQKGFSVIEIIIAVVAVGAIIGLGLVWRNSRRSTEKIPAVNKEQNKDSPQEATQENKPQEATQPKQEEKEPVEETKPPTGTVSGKFSQNVSESTYPSAQYDGYVGITVPKGAKVSKVEFYLGETKPELKHAMDAPTPGMTELYQYNWSLSGLPNGKYRWTVRVYDMQGNYQFAKIDSGQEYIVQIIKR